MKRVRCGDAHADNHVVVWVVRAVTGIYAEHNQQPCNIRNRRA